MARAKGLMRLCLRNKTLCWGLYGLAQGWPKARGQANKAWSKVFCSYSNMVALSDKCNLEKHYPQMESVWKGFWWVRGPLVRQPSPPASFWTWIIVFGCSRQMTKKIFCLECYNIQYHVRITDPSWLFIPVRPFITWNSRITVMLKNCMVMLHSALEIFITSSISILIPKFKVNSFGVALFALTYAFYQWTW